MNVLQKKYFAADHGKQSSNINEISKIILIIFIIPF